MRGRIAARLSYANVAATMALFLALGGGAYAALQPVGPSGEINACFSRRSGDLSLRKGARCGKGQRAVSWSQSGPQGPQGPQGDRGLQGAAGSARAYGDVDELGTLDDARSRNASVTRSKAGVYCVTVPGVSSANASMLVSIDFNDSDTRADVPTSVNLTAGTLTNTGPQIGSFAEWESATRVADCPASDFEVMTFHTQLDPTSTTAFTYVTEAFDESFSFVVP
jgi:hypothetical protein